MWKPISDTANETKPHLSFRHPPAPVPQSLHNFFLGVKAIQSRGGVLLGDGVAKNVSL